MKTLKRSRCQAFGWVLLALLSASAVHWTACDDVPIEPRRVQATVTAPLDGAVITDSVLQVRVEITKNCGCLVQCEFYVDGEHRFTDFVPDYSWDWDIRGVTGEHTVVARGVIVGSVEGSDTVRVTVNP